MPLKKSPKKHMRRDTKVYASNKSKIKTLKTAMKKAKISHEDQSIVQKAQSLADRAARKGLIPRNRVARWVSAIMQPKSLPNG